MEEKVEWPMIMSFAAETLSTLFLLSGCLDHSRSPFFRLILTSSSPSLPPGASSRSITSPHSKLNSSSAIRRKHIPKWKKRQRTKNGGVKDWGAFLPHDSSESLPLGSHYLEHWKHRELWPFLLPLLGADRSLPLPFGLLERCLPAYFRSFQSLVSQQGPGSKGCGKCIFTLLTRNLTISTRLAVFLLPKFKTWIQKNLPAPSSRTCIFISKDTLPERNHSLSCLCLSISLPYIFTAFLRNKRFSSSNAIALLPISWIGDLNLQVKAIKDVFTSHRSSCYYDNHAKHGSATTRRARFCYDSWRYCSSSKSS